MSACHAQTPAGVGHGGVRAIWIVWRAVTRICLFPGQGSQSKGMGADLFARYPDWTASADDILGYSIRELCVEDPRGELGVTTFTQPALTS